MLISARDENLDKLKEEKIALEDINKQRSNRFRLRDLEIVNQQIKAQEMHNYMLSVEKDRTIEILDAYRHKIQDAKDLADANAKQAEKARQAAAQREAETGKIIDLRNAHSELYDVINNEGAIGAEQLEKFKESQKELNVEFEKMQAPATSPVTFWSLLGKEIGDAGDRLAKHQQDFADIANTLNSVGEIYSAVTAEQLEANLARIDVYNDRINSIEGRLSDSLNEQAEGRANTANREIEELERLKAKRAEAQRENEKIARRQIVISKLATSAKIIESTANIIKNSTELGPFGIIAGIAQIGVMLSALANTKAQVQQFAEGGKVRGAGTTTSDSIPARLSDREFVVKADSAERSDRMLNLINEGKISDRMLHLFDSGGNEMGSVTQDYSHVNNNTSAINNLTNSLKNVNLQSNTRKGKVYMINGFRK
jgi:hypothetical protein